MRLVTKLLPSIRTRFCKQSFRTVSNLSPKLPSTFSICGKEYQTDEWTNITPRIVSFVDQRLHQARSNPLCLIADGIKSHFNEFDIFEYPSPVVDLEANFDSLLIAKDHVSRAKADTYYVNSNLLLRSHTSAHQAHCLKKGSNAFVCIADVFRRDAIDKTHFPVFHQCEVLKLCDVRIIYANDSLPYFILPRFVFSLKMLSTRKLARGPILLKNFTSKKLRALLKLTANNL